MPWYNVRLVCKSVAVREVLGVSKRFYLGMAVIGCAFHAGRYAKEAWFESDPAIIGLLAIVAAGWVVISWQVFSVREEME